MIDIVCPSCQARYRLPDGAIGENGRRVSCSACGHAWLAHPEPEEDSPLTLGPEAIAETASEIGKKPQSGHASEMGSRPKPQPMPGPGTAHNPFQAYDSDERLSGTSPYADEEDRGMAAYKAFAAEQDEIDRAAEAGEDAPERTDPSKLPDGPDSEMADRLANDRAKQMEQIRSMLNEIKESPGSTLPPVEEEEEVEEAAPPRPSAIERSLREVEEEERDPLRAKLDQYKRPGGKVGDVKVTRQKMLKKHAKKVRRRRIEEKRGSGTFLTGFLLIVLVVSIMASVYLLHPMIIAKVPEAEPAIRDYVATMDQFRVWAGEQIAALQATIQAIISDE